MPGVVTRVCNPSMLGITSLTGVCYKIKNKNDLTTSFSVKSLNLVLSPTPKERKIIIPFLNIYFSTVLRMNILS